MNTKNILLLLIGIVSVLIVISLAIAVSVVRSQLQIESVDDIETIERSDDEQEGKNAEIMLQKRTDFLEHKSTLPPVNAQTQRVEFLERTPDEDSDGIMEKRKAFLETN